MGVQRVNDERPETSDVRLRDISSAQRQGWNERTSYLNTSEPSSLSTVGSKKHNAAKKGARSLILMSKSLTGEEEIGRTKAKVKGDLSISRDLLSVSQHDDVEGGPGRIATGTRLPIHTCIVRLYGQTRLDYMSSKIWTRTENLWARCKRRDESWLQKRRFPSVVSSCRSYPFPPCCSRIQLEGLAFSDAAPVSIEKLLVQSPTEHNLGDGVQG